MSGVAKITPGYESVCAVKPDGTLWCWGSNYWGQMGTGAYEDKDIPGQVPGLTGVLDASSGGSHVCAVKSDMTVACWGYNADGQLGRGNERTVGPTPARLVCE
jgi:alpha-tubulin suppressor-like RCC1 family protein